MKRDEGRVTSGKIKESEEWQVPSDKWQRKRLKKVISHQVISDQALRGKWQREKVASGEGGGKSNETKKSNQCQWSRGERKNK
jgi:hypothetical protein